MGAVSEFAGQKAIEFRSQLRFLEKGLQLPFKKLVVISARQFEVNRNMDASES